MASKTARKPEPKKPGTSVSTKLEGGAAILVQDEVPEYLRKNVQGQGRGSENVGAEDLVIPRLDIVQSNSPAIIEKDPAFIKGAAPGMLFNSVTRHFGRAFTLVPVHYTKQYLVWRDRKEAERLKLPQQGFWGAFNTVEEAEKKRQAEGGEKQAIVVIDTPQHLCLCVDHDSGEVSEVMISMPRTKAKISRQWNSMIKLAGGDRFARAYEIGTKQESNSKGTFFNFTLSPKGYPAPQLFKRAEELYEKVKTGSARVVMHDADLQGGGAPDPDEDSTRGM